jgi:hypothetical protein
MEKETSESDRRNNKRIMFIKDVEVLGLGFRRSSDLSTGGIYIETVSTFPVGSLLDLRFKLQETDDRVIQVQAKVLYEHVGMGIGLGFVNLSPEDQERIKTLVERN